jgi:hypothetical protein
MAREFTNRLLELVEEGAFNKDQLILELVNWMSEDDVKTLTEQQGWYGFEDLQNPEEYGRDWGMEWYDTRSELE